MDNRNDNKDMGSYCDPLPTEIKDDAFQDASPLALFLNWPYIEDGDFDAKDIRALWLEAFDIDWHGDLSLLPNPKLPKNGHVLSNKDLARVKSRSMYERLCRLLPDATESNKQFAEKDNAVHNSVTTAKPAERRLNSSHIKQTALRLLNVPMRHMWLDVLDDRIRNFPYACAQDCIIEGHDKLLMHIINSDYVKPFRIRNIVCYHHNSQFNYLSMDVAARRGHLDVLEVLHDAGCDYITTSAMDYAAQNGYLDVVKFLHENRTEGCTTNAMDWAAKNGHLSIVWSLHGNRTEGCTTRAMDWAAKNGGLDVVKWLHKNCTEGCTTMAMDSAASNGHLDVVNFLHENRTEGCTSYAMDLAAEHGHLDVVKFSHENRTEGWFTEDVFNYCKSPEIAEMLVQYIPLERKQQILKVSRAEKCKGVGVDVLMKSLRAQINDLANAGTDALMGEA